MSEGIIAGILWAFDTILIERALNISMYNVNKMALFISPLIIAYIHDTASAICMWINSIRVNEVPNIKEDLKSRAGKFIIIGSVLGSPIGMTTYILSIKYIGPGYVAMISSLFPAFGVALSFIFYKDKLSLRQTIGLLSSIIGVFFLGYTSNSVEMKNIKIGIFLALISCLAWAIEAVIIACGIKYNTIKDINALTIRQTVSSLSYGIIFCFIIKEWYVILELISFKYMVSIILAAIFSTFSYFYYFKSIKKIGPGKAMTLIVTDVTWVIILAAVIYKEIPSIKDIICGCIIIFGALTTAKKE